MSAPLPARLDVARLAGEAHVWLCPVAALDVGTTRDRYLRYMDDAERGRLRRFARAQDASLFLAAHGLLRETLSRYAGFAPDQWVIAAAPGGRPELSGPCAATGLRFNLSHSRGMACCIVSHEIDCGIDVEQLDRECAVLAVARRMFAPQEYALLERLSGRARTRRFIALWTLREAYAKARGTGLQRPGRDMYFCLEEDGRVNGQASDSGGLPGAWQFWQRTCLDNWQLAVALRSGAGGVRNIMVFNAHDEQAGGGCKDSEGVVWSQCSD